MNLKIYVFHIFIFTYLYLLAFLILAFSIYIVYSLGTRLINFQKISMLTWKEMFDLFTPDKCIYSGRETYRSLRISKKG